MNVSVVLSVFAICISLLILNSATPAAVNAVKKHFYDLYAELRLPKGFKSLALVEKLEVCERLNLEGSLACGEARVEQFQREIEQIYALEDKIKTTVESWQAD